MSAPQDGRVALMTGGLAATLASTCCLGPLALVALGFSGAWIGNLTALEPYRPIFIGAALVALFAACPITVKKALSRVPGVTDVSVNYETKQATVVFDDTQTTVAALTRATTDAGYPSTPAKGAAK